MKSLTIALTADPELPVPPRLYGGIERIIDMLARGLSARGHRVTLYAHRDSDTDADLVPWPGTSSRSRMDTMRNALTLAKGVAAGRFDVVHSIRWAWTRTPCAALSRRAPSCKGTACRAEHSISPPSANG